MLRDERGNPIAVCVILGSENSDRDMFDRSKFDEYMIKLGLGYHLSFCSAERHLRRLEDYLPRKWGEGIRHYVGVVGWSPRLPAAIGAILPPDALVYGVAKLSPELGSADPAPSIEVSTPGCPIICVGLDKAAAGNTALLIGMIMAQSDLAMAEKVRALKQEINGEPKFDVAHD